MVELFFSSGKQRKLYNSNLLIIYLCKLNLLYTRKNGIIKVLKVLQTQKNLTPTQRRHHHEIKKFESFSTDY